MKKKDFTVTNFFTNVAAILFGGDHKIICLSSLYIN